MSAWQPIFSAAVRSGLSPPSQECSLVLCGTTQLPASTRGVSANTSRTYRRAHVLQCGTSTMGRALGLSMKELWWQRGVVYQIYPLSFQDTNRDGIGDLEGIIRRLEYCAALGIDALWLAPIFPSPMADFGYDVSDYTGIHPMFGTLAQFDLLVAEMKARGLKLILDFVPNHTSDQHPWFEASRSSRDDPKRHWYLWR